MNKNNFKKCVMCEKEGKYATENDELLCKEHWNQNEVLLAEKRGDNVVKI